MILLLAFFETWIIIDAYLFVKKVLKQPNRYDIESHKDNVKEHVDSFDLDKVQLRDYVPNPQKGIREDKKTDERKAYRCRLEKVIDIPVHYRVRHNHGRQVK